MLAGRQVDVAGRHLDRDHRRRVGERRDAVAVACLARLGDAVQLVLAFLVERHLAGPPPRRELTPRARAAAGDAHRQAIEVAVEGGDDARARPAQRREVAARGAAALDRQPGVRRRLELDFEAERRSVRRPARWGTAGS